MKITEPINIMLKYGLPDKKQLSEALHAMQPGETLQVKIENSYAVRTLVETFLVNRLYRIVEIVEDGESSILRITHNA